VERRATGGRCDNRTDGPLAVAASRKKKNQRRISRESAAVALVINYLNLITLPKLIYYSLLPKMTTPRHHHANTMPRHAPRAPRAPRTPTGVLPLCCVVALCGSTVLRFCGGSAAALRLCGSARRQDRRRRGVGFFEQTARRSREKKRWSHEG
jgi:hypothetical protein